MKTQKSKLMGFALTFVMTISLFTGVSLSSQAATKTKDPVNLTIWEHTAEYADAVQVVANLFMQKNPDIKIEVINKGAQYDTLLNTSIQAGDAPDIFWSNGNKDNKLSSIAKIGGVMDLTGKIDLSPYDKMAKSVCYIKNDKNENKLYVTPGATIDTRDVYYHRDIFEKYKLKVPNTLAEFENVCKVLKKNGITPIALTAKTSWDILFTLEPFIAAVSPDWVDQAADGKAKINDARLLKAMDTMTDWIKKGYFSKNGLGSDTTAGLLSFSKKKTAMIINGSWVKSSILKNNPDVKLGAFQMPMAKGGKAMIVTYSVGWAGYAKTQHPNEVLKYLQFAASKEAQQVFVKTIGGIPGLKGISANDSLTQDMGTADRQLDSFYSIIGYKPKADQNPRKLWEDDSTKWIGGAMTAKDLIKEIDAAQDYSKK